jgi:hypothetical protein
MRLYALSGKMKHRLQNRPHLLTSPKQFGTERVFRPLKSPFCAIQVITLKIKRDYIVKTSPIFTPKIRYVCSR